MGQNMIGWNPCRCLRCHCPARRSLAWLSPPGGWRVVRGFAFLCRGSRRQGCDRVVRSRIQAAAIGCCPRVGDLHVVMQTAAQPMMAPTRCTITRGCMPAEELSTNSVRSVTIS